MERVDAAGLEVFNQVPFQCLNHGAAVHANESAIIANAVAVRRPSCVESALVELFQFKSAPFANAVMDE